MAISTLTNAIILDHRKRTDRHGRMQLEIRITYQRKSYYLMTGIKVRPQEWAAGRIVNCLGAKALNDRLSIIYERTISLVNDSIRENRPIDFDRIKNEVWQLSEKLSDETTMIDWMEKQIELLNIGEGTRRHYQTLIIRLREYGKLSDWNQISAEAIYLWDAWLHKLPGTNGPISDAAVHNYHKNLKALLKRAVDFGKIAQNPYANLRGKFRKGEKESVEYLTEQEMKAIENLQLPEGSALAKARDLFVFQMYTGLAYSDSQRFDISQYKYDGQRWIHTGERIKTGVPYTSNLLPPVIRVLERYGMKTPHINNADYNHQLKAIGLMAGINTRMHSHLARHTFATWMLRHGAPIGNVGRMLGQKNLNQTMRYAKVLAESVHEDFDRVAKEMGDY